jgi:hypothetical protein
MAATCTLCARSLGHDTAGVPACHACLRLVAKFLLSRSCDVLSRMWMTSAQTGPLGGADQASALAPELKEWDAATKTWVSPGELARSEYRMSAQTMTVRSKLALTHCVMGNNDLGLRIAADALLDGAAGEDLARFCTVVFKQAMWSGAIDALRDALFTV